MSRALRSNFDNIRLSNPIVRLRQRNEVNANTFRNRIVFKGRQKCLECRAVAIRNGRFVTMFNVNEPYPHKDNCSQKGKF